MLAQINQIFFVQRMCYIQFQAQHAFITIMQKFIPFHSGMQQCISSYHFMVVCSNAQIHFPSKSNVRVSQHLQLFPMQLSFCSRWWRPISVQSFLCDLINSVRQFLFFIHIFDNPKKSLFNGPLLFPFSPLCTGINFNFYTSFHLCRR